MRYFTLIFVCFLLLSSNLVVLSSIQTASTPKNTYHKTSNQNFDTPKSPSPDPSNLQSENIDSLNSLHIPPLFNNNLRHNVSLVLIGDFLNQSNVENLYPKNSETNNRSRYILNYFKDIFDQNKLNFQRLNFINYNIENQNVEGSTLFRHILNASETFNNSIIISSYFFETSSPNLQTLSAALVQANSILITPLERFAKSLNSTFPNVYFVSEIVFDDTYVYDLSKYSYTTFKQQRSKSILYSPMRCEFCLDDQLRINSTLNSALGFILAYALKKVNFFRFSIFLFQETYKLNDFNLNLKVQIPNYYASIVNYSHNGFVYYRFPLFTNHEVDDERFLFQGAFYADKLLIFSHQPGSKYEKFNGEVILNSSSLVQLDGSATGFIDIQLHLNIPFSEMISVTSRIKFDNSKVIEDEIQIKLKTPVAYVSLSEFNRRTVFANSLIQNDIAVINFKYLGFYKYTSLIDYYLIDTAEYSTIVNLDINTSNSEIMIILDTSSEYAQVETDIVSSKNLKSLRINGWKSKDYIETFSSFKVDLTEDYKKLRNIQEEATNITTANSVFSHEEIATIDINESVSSMESIIDIYPNYGIGSILATCNCQKFDYILSHSLFLEDDTIWGSIFSNSFIRNMIQNLIGTINLIEYEISESQGNLNVLFDISQLDRGVMTPDIQIYLVDNLENLDISEPKIIRDTSKIEVNIEYTNLRLQTVTTQLILKMNGLPLIVEEVSFRCCIPNKTIIILAIPSIVLSIIFATYLMKRKIWNVKEAECNYCEGLNGPDKFECRFCGKKLEV